MSRVSYSIIIKVDWKCSLSASICWIRTQCVMLHLAVSFRLTQVLNTNASPILHFDSYTTNYSSRDIFSTLITATVTFCTSIDFAAHHTIRYHLISSSGNASTHCFNRQLLPASVFPLDGSSLSKWDTFSLSACSCWGLSWCVRIWYKRLCTKTMHDFVCITWYLL